MVSLKSGLPCSIPHGIPCGHHSRRPPAWSSTSTPRLTAVDETRQATVAHGEVVGVGWWIADPKSGWICIHPMRKSVHASSHWNNHGLVALNSNSELWQLDIGWLVGCLVGGLLGSVIPQALSSYIIVILQLIDLWFASIADLVRG